MSDAEQIAAAEAEQTSEISSSDEEYEMCIRDSRKTVQLLPSHDAVSLITVLPEQLQSPLLTAEWEYRLGEIERGQLAPEEFLDGISTCLLYTSRCV